MLGTRFITTLGAVACTLVLWTGTAQAVTVDLITNGGFETGDLTGWSATQTGWNNGWEINSGRTDPAGPQRRTQEISGSYDVLTSQTGSGSATLTQYFTVPDALSSAVFSFSTQIMNYASMFLDPYQEFRVNLTDATGSVITEIFSTNYGDSLTMRRPETLSFDLTSYLQSNVGSVLGVSFVEQDALGYMNVSLDDVALMVEVPAAVPLPPTVWMMLAGLGLFGFLGWRRKRQVGSDVTEFTQAA